MSSVLFDPNHLLMVSKDQKPLFRDFIHNIPRNSPGVSVIYDKKVSLCVEYYEKGGIGNSGNDKEVKAKHLSGEFM